MGKALRGGIGSWVGVILLGLVVLEVCALIWVREVESRKFLSNLIQAIGALIAAGALGLAAQKLRREQSEAAPGWPWIAGSACLWAMGMIVFFVVESVLKQQAYPGYADVFLYASYPVMIIGLWRLSVEPLTPRERWNNAIDLGALGLVGAVVIWQFNLRLLVESLAVEADAGVLASLGYTLLDTVLVLMLFSRLVHKVGERRRFVPMLLLVVGCFFLVTSDLLQGYVSTVMAFGSGSFLDLGWLLFSAFCGWAALELLKDRSGEADESLDRFRVAWSVSISYLWIGTVFFILVWLVFHKEETQKGLLVAGVGGAMVLAVTRQVRMLQENAALYRGLQQAHGELETKVRERTAELQAQTELLRTSEQTFRGIVETTRERLWAMAADGRQIYCNPAVQRMLGYTASEFLSLGLECMHPDDRFLFERELPGKVRQGEGWTDWVLRWRHRDGEYRHLESSAVPVVDEKGKVTGFQGSDRDITERIQAQEQSGRLQTQLIQAQKMEAVGQLAGGVAHDFNNILSVILMQLGLLQEEETLKPEIRTSLAELEEQAKRGSNLVRQLLLFGRRQSLQKQLLDLDSLLGNLLKMLRRLIGENIGLEFKNSSHPLWVEADPGMLEQVVMNLVVNARDAMSGGGRITVATEEVEISAEQAAPNPQRRVGRFACLRVTDTGCGMDAETVQRIYEPFFTTKPAGKGTGLGLATVHGIVQRHEGWIEVESVLGAGTTFSVFLPASAIRGQNSGSQKGGPTVQGGKEAVLLVEDNAAVRSLASAVLRRGGYRVIEAVDGQEALKRWSEQEGNVALLVTDMIMPEGMTGLELSERLCRQKPDLKVVIMSGYSPEAALGELPRRPGLAYLSKPFEIATFSRTVRECLDGERPH
jgi:PAS domain S-box-containing protein